MKNSIFNAVCKTRYLALLTVLLFTCGKALGQVTVEDLNFGTPAVSEDFNSCTGSKVQGSGSGAWTGTISNYGNFTNGYTGKTASVSFEIAAASSPMTSKHLKLVSLSNGTGVSFSRSFSTTGAFSFTVKCFQFQLVRKYENILILSYLRVLYKGKNRICSRIIK